MKNMNKEDKIFCRFLIVCAICLSVVLTANCYVSLQTTQIEREFRQLQQERNYAESDYTFEIYHSFFNRIILGGPEWLIYVNYLDEPGISYQYRWDDHVFLERGKVKSFSMPGK